MRSPRQPRPAASSAASSAAERLLDRPYRTSSELPGGEPDTRERGRARQDQTGTKVREALERAGALLQEGRGANDLARLKEAKAEADRAAEVAGSGAADDVAARDSLLRRQ